MLACAVQLPAGRPVLVAMPRSARRCRVDVLSDDDDVHCRGIPGVLRADPRDDVVLSGGEDVLPRAERAVAAQSVLASLKRPCKCSVQKRRRGRDHGVVACCLHAFREPGLLQRLIDQRLQWQQLHKLDQDRLLFGALRLLFNEQGVPTYTVLGQPVIQ